MALEKKGNTKKTGNINIISQVWLKSANMSSKGDFLNNLQVPGKKTDFIRRSGQKSQNFEKSLDNKKKDMKKDSSEDSDSFNSENNQKGAPSRKRKMSKDIEVSSGDDSSSESNEENVNNSRQNKNQKVAKEVLSSSNNSSSSESEQKEIAKCKTNKRKMSKDIKSSSGDDSSSESNQENAPKSRKIKKQKVSKDGNSSSSESEQKEISKSKTNESKMPTDVKLSLNDESSSENKDKNSTSPESSVLKEFLLQNNYEMFENQENLLNNLSDDENIYILQTSKDFNIQSLLNKELPFAGSTNLKLNNNMYKWSVNLDNKPILNLLDFDNLLNVKTVGTVTLQKTYECYNEELHLESIDDIPVYPENLKKRHPLFGPKYKKKLKLSEDILQKLEKPIQHISKKKKKSKKIANDEVEMDNINNLDIFKLLNEHEQQLTQVEDNNEVEHGKKKKKKHKKQTELVKQEIENEVDSLFAQMFDHDIKTKDTTQNYTETVPKHKKKSKNRERSLNEDVEKVLNEVPGDFVKTKKNKKSKKDGISVTNSTMLPASKSLDGELDFDASVIPKVKNKHKKRKESAELDDFIAGLLEDVNSTELKSKHKKHKRKSKDKLVQSV